MNDNENLVPHLGHDHPEPNRVTPGEEVPREGEVSAFARHGDPSLTREAGGRTRATRPRPGVEWVRPSELMLSRSGRIAGRGIDFQAELARRARHVPGQVYRGARTSARTGTQFVSERARRLPPVTAFGRGSGERFTWVSRSGIGLG